MDLLVLRKFFLFLSCFLVFSNLAFVFAEEADDVVFEEFEDLDEFPENEPLEYTSLGNVDEEWDALFGDEEDIDVEQNENPDGSQRTGLDKALSDNLALPLRFSGNLTSGMGAYFNYMINPDEGHEQEDVKDYLSGYFTLSNDLFLTARIDPSLSFRARINTTFPGGSNILSFKELYCDYLFLDRIYFTLGRKKTSWGYTRIFSSGDTYKNEKVLDDNDVSSAISNLEKEGFLHTDILHDTEDSISMLIRIPVWTGMISGIFYYDMGVGNVYPSMGDLKIAGSVEMTFFHTTVNLFGKKYEEKEDEIVTGYKEVYVAGEFDKDNLPTDIGEAFVLKKVPVKEKIIVQAYPLIGLEAKRSFFGYDFYAQGIITLTDWKKFEMNKIFATAGFYKLWDWFIPNIGFNIEYQYSYDFVEELHRNRMAFEFGLKKMGRKNDLKLAVNWQHKFMENVGTVKLLFIKSGIWEHCDWENALEYRYNEESTGATAKFQFLTSLKINVDY